MKNLICIFFGHKDDMITFTGDFKLAMNYTMNNGNTFPLAHFKRCGRCGDIYLKPESINKELSFKLKVEKA